MFEPMRPYCRRDDNHDETLMFAAALLWVVIFLARIRSRA